MPLPGSPSNQVTSGDHAAYGHPVARGPLANVMMSGVTNRARRCPQKCSPVGPTGPCTSWRMSTPRAPGATAA